MTYMRHPLEHAEGLEELQAYTISRLFKRR